ncbi:helix-turn-helix domain-containing protein [Streptosporangium sp. NBC_01756]|uniref:helix-turn-helix domain-containing protein n=1 Tax=Streptosporangium sp. NBC_01756 TaxID=2975950 RepID=UPI002DDBEC1B|nr:helix-turn-helix transcriptional regulator [Streptosporangium sp. NBC_01756]WSC83920.1 helix-turn-helix domain-containing protein [Streptosporangium sp. NBC_01756]
MAEKLDTLFQLRLHPERAEDLNPARRQFSYGEVVEAIRQQTEDRVHISRQYLQMIREGHRPGNLSLDKVVALANFFGVDPIYLYEPGQLAAKDEARIDAQIRRIDEQLKLLQSMRDNQVQWLVGRLLDPSPEGRERISRIVEAIRSLEAAIGPGSSTASSPPDIMHR